MVYSRPYALSTADIVDCLSIVRWAASGGTIATGMGGGVFGVAAGAWTGAGCAGMGCSTIGSGGVGGGIISTMIANRCPCL